VAASLEEAVKDGVTVPQTVEEYCQHSRENAKKYMSAQATQQAQANNNNDFDMDFDDHYYDYGDESGA
jgi:hypothetical protein